MNAKSLIRLAPIVLACQLIAGVALAQQPSAAAVALGRDLVLAKGANQMFEPIVVGVVEQTKATLLQTNPQLAKDLDAVAAQLRRDVVQVLGKLRVGLQQRSLGLLDHAGHDRIEHRIGALGLHQIATERDGGSARLLGERCAGE